MSELEKLIQEQCSNGVEYKTLDELCSKIFAGGTPTSTNSSYYNGNIPWLRSGEINFAPIHDAEIKITEAGYKNSSAKWIKPKSVLMAMTGATVARVGYNEISLTANQSVCALEVGNDVSYRYLYHYLAGQYENIKRMAQGALTSLNLARIKSIVVPIPPIEVQHEIVRILDNFTTFTAALTTELTAELTARKTQLEYYREKIIRQSDNVVKLGEICNIYLGLTATPNYTNSGVKFISAQNTSSDYLNLENTKYISEDDFKKATSNAKPKRGDVLFTRVGSNLGHPVIVDTDEKLCIFVSLGFLRIKDENIVVNRYLKHWMNTDLFWAQVRKNVHGAAKVNLNTGWLKNFEIPLPSKAAQEQICDQLDKLEQIYSDFADYLPAEIEARQKQYEYYREKLLTFKAVGE